MHTLYEESRVRSVNPKQRHACAQCTSYGLATAILTHMLHEGGNYNDMIGTQAPEIASIPKVDVEMHNSWIQRHPYAAVAIGIGGILILGGTIVLQRMSVAPTPQSGSWGGAGGAFFGTVRNATLLHTSPNTTSSGGTDNYAVIPIYDTSSGGEGVTVPEGLAELLALIVRTDDTGTTSTETPSAYSFIPQGLVSAEKPAKPRTQAQDRLHSYGNAVGTLVKPFEDNARINAQTLKNHTEDRNNPEKADQLNALALNLAQLGVDILATTGVPESAAAAHKEYGTAYRMLGTRLAAITKTQTDEEFLNAIVSYNTAAEELTKKFLLLIAIFNTNEITFSSSEPGSIFMFSASGSL